MASSVSEVPLSGRPVAGAVPSPNIWQHTAIYELENRAADPDGRLWAAMESRVSWQGRTVLDLGCGSGFHLPRFAQDAATVVGVEPHPGLVRLAQRRTHGLDSVDVRLGTAPGRCVLRCGRGPEESGPGRR